MSQEVLKAMANQAFRYGMQIVDLEDHNRFSDLALVREAWFKFLTQFRGTEFERAAIRAFSDGYNHQSFTEFVFLEETHETNLSDQASLRWV